MADVKSIYGKIQLVDSFPDYKVEVVSSFPDLKVQKFQALPTARENGKSSIVFPTTKFKS